jgi:RNA polymerase sigma-70 factor (sigma-E family)
VAATDGFVEFATAHGMRLRRTAYLLCGDWHTAQDLTQTTLIAIFVAWKRIERTHNVYAYAQRTLLNNYLSQKRRRSSAETPTDSIADRPVPAGSPEVGLVLRQALAQLSPKAPAVVVLRYWTDTSVADVAAMLDMTEVNVRAHSVRALETLRGLLGDSRLDLITSH